MKNRDWPWLFLGFLVVALLACRPMTEDDPEQGTLEPALGVTPATAIAQQSTSTRLPPAESTSISPPPPQPTPEPTSGSRLVSTDDWRQFGEEEAGLEIAGPPQWIDLAGRIDVSAATSPLGLIVLLLADAERTGESLLANKELTSGAFVAGFVSNLEDAPEDPVDALLRVVEQIGSTIVATDQPSPVTISSSSTTLSSQSSEYDVEGAYVDVTGDPADFFTTDSVNLRSRIFLFPSQALGDALLGDTQAAIFLMSATANEWDEYDELFAMMTETIAISGVDSAFSIGDGTADVLGALDVGQPIAGKLEQGVKELWTFTVDEASYATLTLSPTDKDIDLTMAIFGPAGQIVSRVDAGYDGDAEVAADLFLDIPGLYVVEVGEFADDSGRYSLSLVLNEGPRFIRERRIASGEGVQSVLPDNTRQFWTFEGTAGEIVSIILTPVDDKFDVILDLYGPENQRLVALDEGFSGDAEVISGFELPVTGEYSILVRSFAGNGGVYTLSLDEGGEATLNYYDAGDLVDADIKRETLRDHEAHAWFFQGRQGDAVAVEVVPINEALDLDLWLLDPDVRKLVTEDRFGVGEAESIEAMLDQDGQYLLLVRDFLGKPGEYEIRFTSVLANGPVDAGILRYGETVTDTLAPGQPVLWRFWGDVDDVVDLKVTPLGADDDLLFILQDPATNSVLEVDAALAGDSEEYSGFTITIDGQWGIIIKDFFGDGGEYALTINRSRGN